MVDFYDDILDDFSQTKNIDQNQFMLGNALLVAPVLEKGRLQNQNRLQKNVYFPRGTFYDFFNGQKIGTDLKSNIVNLNADRERLQFPHLFNFEINYIQITIDTLSQIPIYIRGGQIITFQNVTHHNLEFKDNKVLNTVDLKTKLGYDLFIAFEQTNASSSVNASGTFIIDDGKSLQEKKEYNSYLINAEMKEMNSSYEMKIEITKNHNGYDLALDQQTSD